MLCVTALCSWSVGFAQETETTTTETTTTEDLLLDINSALGDTSSGDSESAASNSGISTLAITEGSASGTNTLAIGTSASTAAARTGSIAIGASATTTNSNGIAIGSSAKGTGGHVIAIGYESNASSSYAVAIGNASSATERNSVAIGSNAKATEENTVSFGDPDATEGPKTRRLVNVTDGINDTDAATVGQLNKKAGGLSYDSSSATTTVTGTLQSTGAVTGTSFNGVTLSNSSDNALAIGTSASAAKTSSIAIGVEANAANSSSIAIGASAQATNGQVIAIGKSSSASASNAIAIGSESSASANYAVAIGPEATVGNRNAVAIGYQASNVGSNSVAIGSLSSSTHAWGIAIGTEAVSNASSGLAIGGASSATGNQGIAIGIRANVSAQNALALGAYSKATEANTVSFGDPDATGSNPKTRRLVNVTDGINDTDAATVGQLKKMAGGLTYDSETETTTVTGILSAGAITGASFNGVTLSSTGGSGSDIIIGNINLTQMAQQVGVGTNGEGESLSSRVSTLEKNTAGIGNTTTSEKYDLSYETADGQTKNYTSITQEIAGNDTITQGYTAGQIIDVEAERSKLMEQYSQYMADGNLDAANDVLEIVQKLNDSSYIQTAQGSIETSKTTIGSGVDGETAGIEVTTKTTEVYDAETGSTKKVTENFITMNGAVNGVTIGTEDRTIGGVIQYGDDGSALQDVVFNGVNINEIQRNTAGITNTTTSAAGALINSAGEVISNVQQVNVDGITGYTKGQYIDLEAEKAKLMKAFQNGDVSALDTLTKLTADGAVSTVQGNTTTVTTGIGSGVEGQANGIEVTTTTKDVWNGSTVTQQTTNKITMNGDVDVKGTLSAEKIVVNGSELDLGNLAGSIETTDTGIIMGNGAITVTNAADGTNGAVAVKGDLSVSGTINGITMGYVDSTARAGSNLVIGGIDLTDMKDKVDNLWENRGSSGESGSGEGGSGETPVITDGVAKSATETDSDGNVTTTTVETKADGLYIKTEVTDKDGNVTSSSSKNISQSIDDLQASMNDVTSQMNDLDRKVGELDDRISDVGAMAAAMSSLKTLGYDPDAPTEISAGIGSYDNSTAYALGIFHYANRDLMFNLQYASAGNSENMVSGGVTVRLGRSGKKSEAVQRVSEPVTVIAEAEKPAIEARYSGKTNDFLASVAEGDYAKAENLMAPVMKQRLTKDVFTKLQTVMTEQFGALNGLTLEQAQETEQGIEVEYRADFEKQGAHLIIGYERKAGDPKIISFVLEPMK